MSRRREILDDIASRLRDIAGVVRVAPWRQGAFDRGELPAILWRDKVEKIDQRIIGRDRYLLTVHYASLAVGSSGVARELLADMLATVGSDTRHNGRAVATTPLACGIGLEVSGDTVAGALLELEILYETASPAPEEINRLMDEDENHLVDEDGEHIGW